MIVQSGDHFGKRSVSSLTYFLNFAYFDIQPSPDNYGTPYISYSGPDLRGIVDDINLVAWRKGNKAGIILSAIVDKDVKENDEITVGFALKFIYTNTVPALEQREVQTSEIITPVYITLGSVQKN